MNLPCLGIDIAKVKFNVCLLQLNGKLKHKVFPNSAAGFAQLQESLEQQEAPLVHACLEATGTYGEALLALLKPPPPCCWLKCSTSNAIAAPAS